MSRTQDAARALSESHSLTLVITETGILLQHTETLPPEHIFHQKCDNKTNGAVDKGGADVNRNFPLIKVIFYSCDSPLSPTNRTAE